MHVEVDQSNRTDESGDTYLAFSDGISSVIKVPSKVKNAGMRALRRRRKTRKMAKVVLFTACVFLLIKDHLGQLGRVTVDNAFDGYQDEIRAQLLRHIWTVEPNFDAWSIEVLSIGKGSPAHAKAWSARAEGKADRTITTEEMLELVG